MINQIKIEQLIEDVKRLNREYEIRRRAYGKDFNIFHIIATESDEIRTCRLIKELIDPKGSHGQGSIFLEQFLTYVLEIDPKEFNTIDYINACVTREEVIDSARRIDLCIRINNRFIPIEVKIYAGDQEKQCQDYYEYAISKDRDSVIYYLTLDGHEPDESSKGKLSSEQIKCISFEHHILRWIEECIKLREIESLYNIREILIQFREVINRLTGQEENEIKMEIESIIIASPENYHAAKLIADTIPIIQADKMCEVFKAIEIHMENKGFVNCYPDYEENAHFFYKNHKRTRPNLNYIIRSKNPEIKQIYSLRFEIDWRLYFGICNWNEEKNDITPNVSDNVQNVEYVSANLTPSGQFKSTSHWYWWKYAVNDSELNFWECDDMYEKLYTKSGFDEVMGIIFSNLDSVLAQIF